MVPCAGNSCLQALRDQTNFRLLSLGQIKMAAKTAGFGESNARSRSTGYRLIAVVDMELICGNKHGTCTLVGRSLAKRRPDESVSCVWSKLASAQFWPRHVLGVVCRAAIFALLPTFPLCRPLRSLQQLWCLMRLHTHTAFEPASVASHSQHTQHIILWSLKLLTPAFWTLGWGSEKFF